MKNKISFSGFTLAEMAVVLVIVGLLLGGLLIPLSTQNDIRYINETQKTMNDIRDALIGFASANGRLPCPASSAGTSGVESFTPGPVGVGSCTSSHDGFVPGTTLGIGPTDTNHLVIDAWGNPIHYALTSVQGNAFATTNGIKTATMATLSGLSNPNPAYLSVCSSGAIAAITNPGATNAGCIAANTLTNNAVAVIYSLGKNVSSGGNGIDEKHNPNPRASLAAIPVLPDTAFVSHEPRTTLGNEFDDIVIWISPNTLYNRMIAAGQLP